MEYVPGGNLEKQIETGMTFIEIKILAFQMLSALAYLHEKGIVHRDVKPANILCETRKHYKLADFGVSREIAPLLSMQGTAAYMAPEVCEDSPYGYPADLWSLGVVLAECMNGLPRYRVGTTQWEWSEKVIDKFERYVSECEAEPDKMISGASDLLHLVKDALLQDLTSKRKLAQECLDKYPSLGEGHDEDLDLDAGSGALTPTQGHPNGSFPPAPAGESDDEDDEDEDEEPTSHSNGEGAIEEGESSQDSDDDDDGTAKPNDASAGPSRAEDPITAVRAKANSHSGGSDAPSADSSIGEGEPADPAHDSADPESAAKGKLYTPDHAFTSSPSVSDEEENPAASGSDEEDTPAASISDEEEPPAASISDANAKRRRASHSSEEPDENEANVSPSDVRPGSSKHDEKRSRPSASSSESEEE